MMSRSRKRRNKWLRKKEVGEFYYLHLDPSWYNKDVRAFYVNKGNSDDLSVVVQCIRLDEKHDRFMGKVVMSNSSVYPYTLGTETYHFNVDFHKL